MWCHCQDLYITDQATNITPTEPLNMENHMQFNVTGVEEAPDMVRIMDIKSMILYCMEDIKSTSMAVPYAHNATYRMCPVLVPSLLVLAYSSSMDLISRFLHHVQSLQSLVRLLLCST